MKNKWLAVGSGLIYSGDVHKLKLAIFRVLENHRAYPMLVKPTELQLDDLLFLETSDKSDYCKLEDFHLNDKGEIDYWVFSESGIPIPKQTAMMKMTRTLLNKEFNSVSNDGDTLLISIRQKQANSNE